MSLLDSIILGIVEGITEFLPVSSTGHLILTSHLLGLETTEFLKTFEIAIQLGAILSVVALYWKTLTTSIETWKRIFIAFIPTGILGLIFYKSVKNLLGSEAVVLWALFLGGIFLIGFELWQKKNLSGKLFKRTLSQAEAGMASEGRAEAEKSALASQGQATRGEREQAFPTSFDVSTLPLPKAFTIGLFQAVAMIPGVSRSGATIIGGLLLGLERKTIVEFSFLLAIPTMLAATGFDLYKNASAFSSVDFTLLAVGFIAAFVSAFLAVKTFLRFIESHSFISFGVYRIAIAAAFFFFLF